jgi:uncharacterized protein YciI
VIVYHVAIRTADNYLVLRAEHRPAHLDRLQALRAAGIVIGGGPSPDGTVVDIVYRLQRPEQLVNAVEEDPYWMARLWVTYTPRSFAEFVEPWALPPLVTDGSRRLTIVEGATTEHEMAQFALIEMRGAGRIHFGGFFDDDRGLALATTPDAEAALGWFRDSGFWRPDTLTARPFLHVL